MSSETLWAEPSSSAGNVLSSTPLDASTPAGFSINCEEVAQAIVDLEHAADFFDKRALHLATIPAPGADGVGSKAIAQISRWASGTAGNKPAATLKAGAKQLRDIAQELRGDLKTCLQVEQLNLPKYPSSRADDMSWSGRQL